MHGSLKSATFLAIPFQKLHPTGFELDSFLSQLGLLHFAENP
jgi:hypothetical protein